MYTTEKILDFVPKQIANPVPAYVHNTVKHNLHYCFTLYDP